WGDGGTCALPAWGKPWKRPPAGGTKKERALTGSREHLHWRAMKKLLVLLLCAFALSTFAPEASAALFHRSGPRIARTVKPKVQKVRKARKARKAVKPRKARRARAGRKATPAKPSQQAMK